jgi:hypothetical protein
MDLVVSHHVWQVPASMIGPSSPQVAESPLACLKLSLLTGLLAPGVLALSVLASGVLVVTGCDVADEKEGDKGADGGSAAKEDGGDAGGDDVACPGGVVIDGKCEAKCEASLCSAGNICAGNRCMLSCDSHLDCTDGTQNCEPTTNDETGEDAAVCMDHNKSTSVVDCRLDDDACPEGFECATAGEGDASAECIKLFCTSDDECAGGYECIGIREATDLCADKEGGKKPWAGCDARDTSDNEGTGSGDCFEESDLAADGSDKSYYAGPICALKKACVPKVSCSVCSTDLDCSLLPGHSCVNLGEDKGGKACLLSCNPNNDGCGAGFECAKTAGDPDSGFCVPEEGGCRGDGGFCAPCISDDDCTSNGAKTYCATGDGQVRGCFDRTFPDSCSSDEDCPVSPQSGKQGHCINQSDVADGFSESLLGLCYFPKKGDKFACAF